MSVGGEVESDSDRESEVLHRVEVHAEPRDSDSRSQMQRHRNDVDVNQSTNTQSWFVGLDGQVSADVTRGRSSNRTNRMRTRSMSRREQTPTGEVELHTKRRSNVNNGNEVVSRARREALLERSNNANMEAKKTINPSNQVEKRMLLGRQTNRNLAYDDERIQVLADGDSAHRHESEREKQLAEEIDRLKLQLAKERSLKEDEGRLTIRRIDDEEGDIHVQCERPTSYHKDDSGDAALRDVRMEGKRLLGQYAETQRQIQREMEQLRSQLEERSLIESRRQNNSVLCRLGAREQQEAVIASCSQVSNGGTHEKGQIKKMMYPEKFDGTSSVSTFLTQFGICIEHNGWDEKEKKNVMLLSLRGIAADLISDKSNCRKAGAALRSKRSGSYVQSLVEK